MKLLNDDQAAERLNVRPRTLQAWRQRGVGPPYARIEGTIRYPEDGLERYVEERLCAPQQAAQQ